VSQSRQLAPAGIGAIEIEHGDRARPLIALTFHGSGDPNLTTRLLRLVEHEGVHVSVMAVGMWVNAYPELTRRVLHGGHDLGNHTMHHLSMLDLSAVRVRAEIEQCADALRRATGSQGQWFRASATQHTNATIRIAAGHAGYDRCISYDVDGLDWQAPSASTVERAVLTAVRPGSIVSLHLGHPVTIAALPAILSGLRDRRLAAVSLTELLG
jgi:peptidoglycan/xylan/chitin deacetylase (PgdA/CDA1 family)